MNYTEAVEVVRTARANRVFLMEGFLCRRHPQTAKLVELLRQGAIGKVTLIQLQRRLGQLERCELSTLRWRLFARAAVWSRAQGRPTLRLAVQGKEARQWWTQILEKLTAPPNCHAVASFAA